jgi:hypothetical protein
MLKTTKKGFTIATTSSKSSRNPFRPSHKPSRQEAKKRQNIETTREDNKTGEPSAARIYNSTANWHTNQRPETRNRKTGPNPSPNLFHLADLRDTNRRQTNRRSATKPKQNSESRQRLFVGQMQKIRIVQTKAVMIMTLNRPKRSAR